MSKQHDHATGETESNAIVPVPLTPAGSGATPVTATRSASGRFLPGNREGRGNPANRRAQKLRNALIRAVTPDDVRAVAATLTEAAKSGDVQAAKLLLSFVVGRPASTIELDAKVAAVAATASVALTPAEKGFDFDHDEFKRAFRKSVEDEAERQRERERRQDEYDERTFDLT